MAAKIVICSFVLVFLFFLLLSPPSQISAHESKTQEFVLTLDHSNFSDTVKKHNLIVVEFYAPWCDRSKKLATGGDFYEQAASILSSHDPPVVLAKIDADDEKNKDLATEFEVRAYPTIRILRNGGKNVQEYKGPREADGIAEYLKKQSGPASAEIKSVDDATAFIGEDKVAIVGVFPKFSGEEFDNFTVLAEKLRADYDFGHTLNAKHLPRGESSVAGPLVRLFKPFDELFVDCQDFHVEALEKFVEESSVPVVTVFNSDMRNHPFIAKFFSSPIRSHPASCHWVFAAGFYASLSVIDNYEPHFPLVSFQSVHHSERAETFKSKYRETAEQYRQPGVSFLVGDVRSTTGSFQYFGVREDQVPLILVQRNDGKKFLKPNLEPDHISTWFKAYKDGNIAPYFKSEPIPEANNEPVKVVVGDSLQDIVFNCGKNVLLEFYSPWCIYCTELAPILEEVAVSYKNDADVIIAKLDGVANDISSDSFEAKRYPTLYFRSASAKISKYSGNRTKEDIIEFIEKNRDKPAHQEQAKGDKEKGKDEL